MGSCANCGTTILWGGVQHGRLTFCGESCAAGGTVLILAEEVPQEHAEALADEMRSQPCPKCQGRNGPIDVHVSHTVWSALILTSWKSSPELCCRGCATSAQVGAIALSGVVGWWGFPWGLIMTPVQICRNFGGLFFGPSRTRPSKQMIDTAKRILAARALEAHRAQQQE